jgi:hypothetical protein
MAKTRLSSVATPRIVQPGDRSRTWLWVVFAIVLAVWTWQVFEFGRQQAGFSASDSHAREDELVARILALQAERDELLAAAARFERAGQIDRAAVDGVQARVKALQDERAELKREVAFLKTLVSGEEYELKLAGPTLVELGDGAFRFEVTLSKGSVQAGTVQGEAVFKVKGTSDGAEKVLEMEALTDGRRSRIGIKFNNFQKLSAELKLPNGFEPAAIVVAVKPGSKGFKAFEQTYDWQVSDA